MVASRRAESCRVNREETIKLWNALKMYSEDDMDFQRRVFQRSGLAIDGTYLPPALAPRGCGWIMHFGLCYR